MADQTAKVVDENGDQVLDESGNPIPKYNGIEGTLVLTQEECDDGPSTLKIQGDIACPNGLCDDENGSTDYNHGFHVHTYGRVTNAKENQLVLVVKITEIKVLILFIDVEPLKLAVTTSTMTVALILVIQWAKPFTME